MPGLSQISYGTVSSYNAPVPSPSGNAETITNALGPWTGKPGFDKGAREAVLGAATTGFFTYNEPSCRGGGIGGPGIGKGLLSAGLGAVPIVGGVLQKAFGIFGAHHAAAVKKEQATLCQAVPDANNFLRAIDSAVAQGQLDPSAAAQALEQGYQNWRDEVAGILQDSGSKCNAACVYEKVFRAAIEKRKQDYALMGSTLAANAQGVLGGVVSAFRGAVSSVQQAFSPSPLALAEAGLTPARQGSLAIFVALGIGLAAVALFSNFFGGSK